MKYVSICAVSFIASSFLYFASAQTNDTETGSSTYRLPTVTVFGASPNSTQAVTQVANAVTVLSGEQVKPGGIQNTRELGTYLPNVTVFDANNDRSPKFSVRGLRENNFATGDPAIGFYVDDVPYTDLNSRGLALFDIEQVELLRGPQGTLFGASGPGGVINIVTRQPGPTAEGRAGFTYGNYDQQIYEASLRGPIVAEKLSLGFSGLYSTRDGFVHNRANDTHPDDKETLAGRVQLRWTPTETLDFSVVLHGQKFNDGFVPTYYPAVDSNPFSVRRDFNGFVDTDTWGTALKGSFANEVVKVTSITSYRNWKQNLLQDFDFSPSPVRLGFAKPDLDQWSQELRVQSNDESKDLQWLGGFFFSRSDLSNNTGSRELTPVTLSTNPAPFVLPTSIFRTRSETDAETYAIFGQAGYDLTEKLNVIAGVRFTVDQRNIDRSKIISAPGSTFGGFPAGPFSNTNGAYRASDDFTDVSPKFGVSYNFTESFGTYASISRGYQSGGFNTSNDSATGAKFDPSHSWNYEAGVKSKWLEDRLLANLAIFYTDTHDYQVYRINSSDPSQAYIVNADQVRSYGAELDLSTRPCKNVDLSAAFGVTQASFDKFTDKNGRDFDDKDVNFVPEFTANIAMQYRFPCHLYARVEYQAIGNYYLDEDNSAKQSAYGLLNARIGYQRDHFEIYVFGKNLLDKEYINNALDLRNSFQPDLLIRQPGDPMTIGIALSANF